MRCQKHICPFKRYCKYYYLKSEYKLIIENPNTQLCEYQPTQKAIS